MRTAIIGWHNDHDGGPEYYRWEVVDDRLGTVATGGGDTLADAVGMARGWGVKKTDIEIREWRDEQDHEAYFAAYRAALLDGVDLAEELERLQAESAEEA